MRDFLSWIAADIDLLASLHRTGHCRPWGGGAAFEAHGYAFIVVCLFSEFPLASTSMFRPPSHDCSLYASSEPIGFGRGHAFASPEPVWVGEASPEPCIRLSQHSEFIIVKKRCLDWPMALTLLGCRFVRLHREFPPSGSRCRSPASTQRFRRRSRDRARASGCPLGGESSGAGSPHGAVDHRHGARPLRLMLRSLVSRALVNLCSVIASVRQHRLQACSRMHVACVRYVCESGKWPRLPVRAGPRITFWKAAQHVQARACTCIQR